MASSHSTRMSHSEVNTSNEANRSQAALELVLPFQNQDQIDDFFKLQTSLIATPPGEFLELIFFIVKLGEQQLGNKLLQQLIIIEPQFVPYSSLRLAKRPMLPEPQRSTVEFTKLLKNALKEKTSNIKEKIQILKLCPLDATEEIHFWADLSIHHCLLKHRLGKGLTGIEKNVSLSQANEIIPILIEVGKDINSMIFLEFAREFAEAHASHHIYEIETIIATHKNNPELNIEQLSIHTQKNSARIKQRINENTGYIDRICQAMLNNTTNPHNLTPIIQTICELLPKNHYMILIATFLLKLYLQLLCQSNNALKHLFPIKEEKTELKIIPKENKLEKMEPLSPQEYSDLTNDQLNALTSPEHYSYHVRNMYAAAIECKEILPFNSIQFGLFKNKEWQSSIDTLLQVVYQTPLTDSSSILFMLAHFLVGVGKIQKAAWLLQFLQSKTASVVVKSKLNELQAKTKSISLELPKSQATSAALNPKKLENSKAILQTALANNPDISDRTLPLFQKPPKPIQFLDLLVNIVKESHPAIIAFVLREYCFGYSYSNDIRKKAIFVPILEGPGPRQKPAKKAKAPVNEEKKVQPPNKKKNNAIEEKENAPVQPLTNSQPIDSTVVINQIFKMMSDDHKESKLNTSTPSSSHETKKMSSPRVSLKKSSHLESSLSDFLPYVSPLTIPKIQEFLDNVQKIGATVYVYGSAHDYWLLDKTKNKPTFIPNDFDLKINCQNLTLEQIQRIFVEIKRLIPEITQQKMGEHYAFVEGKMDEYHVCNITLEKAGYKKTQDPIVISDCQSEIKSSGVTFNLEVYTELKHNLEQKVFSIRPLTASPTETELSAQSVLMRVVKKAYSICQLSDLKPDDSVSRLFSFTGALQFFKTISYKKVYLELGKLFDWAGKQITSHKKTSSDFCKEGTGGLLPFIQAYIAYRNNNENSNEALKTTATELLQYILATENPEKLFQYNYDSLSFPIDNKLKTLITPQRNHLLPTHAIANTMFR